MPVHATKTGVVLIAGLSEAKVSSYGAHLCASLAPSVTYLLARADQQLASTDSWTIDGEEQIFLSSAVESLTGPAAIRGGIPICFPGQHRSDPINRWARTADYVARSLRTAAQRRAVHAVEAAWICEDQPMGLQGRRRQRRFRRRSVRCV